jgi:probable F420-dependent oxidoreductase
MTQLKVGIYLPSFAYRDDGIDHAGRLRTWVVRAEELGFDSLWVTDHMLRAREMYARPWLEPLATLAFAAALTKRVLLGPGVLLLPLRQPVLLAKELASIQALSNGRFILGAGTGWFPPEFAAVGAKRSERGKRTDETLEIVRRLLRGETLTYRGSFVSLDNVDIEPSPVPMPVWIGGGSQAADEASVEKPVMHPQVARRIASADGWFTRPSAPPEEIANDWEQLQPYLAEAGRSPDDLVIGHGQWLHLTEEDNHDRAVEIQHEVASHIVSSHRPKELLERYYLFGTLDEVVEACRKRTEIGVEHLILHPYTDDPAQLELWGSALLPRLKALEVKRPAVTGSAS